MRITQTERSSVISAEERSIRWAYGEFGAGFGVYDRSRNAWNEEILRALAP